MLRIIENKTLNENEFAVTALVFEKDREILELLSSKLDSMLTKVKAGKQASMIYRAFEPFDL